MSIRCENRNTWGTAQRQTKHLMYIKRPLLEQLSLQVHFLILTMKIQNSLHIKCTTQKHTKPLNEFLILLFLDKTQRASQLCTTFSLSKTSEMLWDESRYFFHNADQYIFQSSCCIIHLHDNWERSLVLLLNSDSDEWLSVQQHLQLTYVAKCTSFFFYSTSNQTAFLCFMHSNILY